MKTLISKALRLGVRFAAALWPVGVVHANTLNGMGERTVEAKTANYTVTANDCGKTFTNEGASGAITFALPAATVGLWYNFVVMAAQQLRIDPNGTETIGQPGTGVQNTAGQYVWADAAGERVAIECVKAGQWSVRDALGTWTAV